MYWVASLRSHHENLSRTVRRIRRQTSRLADIDTEQLDSAAAQEVEQVLSQLSERSAQSSELVGADLLRYTVTVSDSGSTRTIRVSDDGSPEVSQLMEW